MNPPKEIHRRPGCLRLFLILILILIGCRCPAQSGTQVYFNSTDFSAVPNNTPLTLRPVMLVQVGGASQIMLGYPIFLVPTNGSATNFAAPALYQGTFQGFAHSIQFLVPASTNLINLANCTNSTLETFSSMPYPIIVTNQNFLVQGTNVQIATNGWQRTISANAAASYVPIAGSNVTITFSGFNATINASAAGNNAVVTNSQGTTVATNTVSGATVYTIGTNGLDTAGINSLSNLLNATVIPNVNANSNSAAATQTSLASTIVNANTQSNLLATAIVNVNANSNTAAATQTSLASTIVNANSQSNLLATAIVNVNANSNTAAATQTSLTATISSANSQSNFLNGTVVPNINTVSNSAAATQTSLASTITSANANSNSLFGTIVPNINSNSNNAAATQTSLASTIVNANSQSNLLATAIVNVNQNSNNAVHTNETRPVNLASSQNTLSGNFFGGTNYATTNLYTTNLAAGLSYTNYGGFSGQHIVNVTVGAPYFYWRNTALDALIIVATNFNDAGVQFYTGPGAFYPTQPTVTFYNSTATSGAIGDVLYQINSTNFSSWAGVFTGLLQSVDGGGLFDVPYAAIVAPPGAGAGLTLAGGNFRTNGGDATLPQLTTTSNALAIAINSVSNATGITAAQLGVASNNIIGILAPSINSASNAAALAVTTNQLNSASNALVAASAAAYVPFTAGTQTLTASTAFNFTNANGAVFTILATGEMTYKNNAGAVIFHYLPVDGGGQPEADLNDAAGTGLTANERGTALNWRTSIQAIFSNGIANFFGTDLRASNQTQLSPFSLLIKTNADVLYQPTNANLSGFAQIPTNWFGVSNGLIIAINGASNAAQIAGTTAAAVSNLAINAQVGSQVLTNTSIGASNNYAGQFNGAHIIGLENLTGFTNTIVGNGQQPDLNVGPYSTALINGYTAAINIPGLAGGTSNRAVRLIFTNSFSVTFNDRSLGDGVATNRIWVPGGDLTVQGPTIASFIYLAPMNLWYFLGASGYGGATNGIQQLNGTGTGTILTNPTLNSPLLVPANLGTFASVLFPASSIQTANQLFTISGSSFTSGPALNFQLLMTNNPNGFYGTNGDGYAIYDPTASQDMIPGLQATNLNSPGIRLINADYGIPIAIMHNTGGGNNPDIYLSDDTNGPLVEFPLYDGVSGHNWPLPLAYYYGTTNLFNQLANEPKAVEINRTTGKLVVYNFTNGAGMVLANGATLTTTNGIVFKSNGTLNNVQAFDGSDSGTVNLSAARVNASFIYTGGFTGTGGGTFSTGALNEILGADGSGWYYNNGSGFILEGGCTIPQIGMVKAGISVTGSPAIVIGGQDSGQIDNTANWQNASIALIGSISTVINGYTTSLTNAVTNSTVLMTGSGIIDTLPAANTNAAGRKYVVKNLNSTALNINTRAAQTIDGQTNWVLPQREAMWVQSDGTNFQIIGFVGPQTEAGGTNVSAASTLTVQFVQPFLDTNFVVTVEAEGAALASADVTTKTTNSFSMSMTSFTGRIDWTAVHNTQ